MVNLFFEFRCLLLHTTVTHGLVFRGISLYLCPIKCDMTKLYQACFLAKTEYLDEKTGKSLEMTFAEISYGIMIRMLVGREYPKRNRVIGRLFNLAGRWHPHRIGIEKKAHHHRRIIGWLPPTFQFIGAIDLAQINLLHHIHDEVHKIVLGQPLLHVLRKQKQLVWIVWSES